MTLGDQRGFMTMGAHLIGVVLFVLSLLLTAIILDKWQASRPTFWLLLAASFVPLFVATHALAAFIARKAGL